MLCECPVGLLEFLRKSFIEFLQKLFSIVYENFSKNKYWNSCRSTYGSSSNGSYGNSWKSSHLNFSRSPYRTCFCFLRKFLQNLLEFVRDLRNSSSSSLANSPISFYLYCPRSSYRNPSVLMGFSADGCIKISPGILAKITPP